MFDKILIANRGEIACRIIRSARRLGIATVAVFSDADRRALHVRMADEAVHIGPARAAESYLSIERILEAVRQSGAQAVHPGYGFLSENPDFARALAAGGVVFIGPPPEAIAAMGDKVTAKRIAAEAGVNTVPGAPGVIADADAAVAAAETVGYPVMLKASAGGGGKGMRIALDAEELREAFPLAAREAEASFGDGRLFLERYITRPRHIEIQILADTHGNCIHLGERECSIQRRNQKVVEEAPSPFLDDDTRAAMGAQAVALAQAVGYASAGTVEFIVDQERRFHFLEMNTRLQVEHPVTELVTGIDLVEQMIRVAAGEELSLRQEDIRARGWAIEARVYAEDPLRGFLPSTGRLVRYRPPEERAGQVRNDAGVEEGARITPDYDPMIAKLCTWNETRAGAVEEMAGALDSFEIDGIGHNLPFLAAVMEHPRFRAGDLSTGFIAEEWPEGFAGVEKDEETCLHLAAAAVIMARVAEARAAQVSGQLRPPVPGSERVVTLAGRQYEAQASEDVVTIAGRPFRIESDWAPGRMLAHFVVGDRPFTLQVTPVVQGFRIRHRGADIVVHIRTPRQAELAALMPVKAPPDLSRLLLCPMPGQVVGLAVAEGDEVQAGQPLVTVEAMKMENILRAPRSGRIARIHVAQGQSLKVDEVILEFEGG